MVSLNPEGKTGVISLDPIVLHDRNSQNRFLEAKAPWL